MGRALWDPNPDQSVHVPEYQRDGLDIGDVDMITSNQGNFHYYFNIALEAEHPKNSGRTPSGFQKLNLSSRDTRGTRAHKPQGSLSSVKLDLSRAPNAEESWCVSICVRPYRS